MRNPKLQTQRIGKFNIMKLKKVCDILYASGRDMAIVYGLQHWNNSYFKTVVIVALCNLKNSIYLVYEGNEAVATFQIKQRGQDLCFQKLAVIPCCKGKGLGSDCIFLIQCIAKDCNCRRLICEVYDKSEYAIRFYEHKGFSQYGTVDTLKYNEIKMEKIL